MISIWQISNRQRINAAPFAIPVLIGYLLLSSPRSAEIPVGIPQSDNLFLIARELYGRGLLEKLEYLDPELSEQTAANDFESELLREYRFLYQSYSSNFDSAHVFSGILGAVETARLGKPNSSQLRLFPGFRADLNKSLSSTVIYRIDSSLPDDPRYDGKSWRGWAGFAENATIDYSHGNLKLGFGIERISWGLGNYGNLMFSRQALPMTVLRMEYKTGRLDFYSISGFLSPLHDELIAHPDDPGYFTNQQRYLSAHSLSIRLANDLSFSLREAVVYGGPGRRFEPAYAFPLIWYHGYQLNSGLDDNTLVSAGFDYRYSGAVWVYGELLIDDFQIDSKSAGDREPNQLGYLIGCEAYDLPAVGTSIGIEYGRINNRVYNQPRPHNRFMNRNFPIGFPDGPDNDLLSWGISYWPFHLLRLMYSGSYQRVGEGRINSPWTTPWIDNPSYSEPFPTGLVQRKVANRIDVLVLDKLNFWGKMGIQLSDIKNVGNIPENSMEWEFSIEIGYDLPQFGWGF